MYGNIPVKNTVYTPYIRMYVWFRPTLAMECQRDCGFRCIDCECEKRYSVAVSSHVMTCCKGESVGMPCVCECVCM